MIVKIHSRGVGRGSGPVEYLLGKDGNRSGATLDRGDPEMVKELIDGSRYAQRYTSGVLSFHEPDLPRETKERLMDEFEQALLPGLDADQYAVLWVEHRDKDRLELNFVVPNVELLSGKRLQPYFHGADGHRINAWRTAINGELGLHDPDDPINRQAVTTAKDQPRNKLEAEQAITGGLLGMAAAGLVKNREDVLKTLTGAGFDVTRTTKNSISIADPEGGRNIRLKGAIYEQDFRHGKDLRADIEAASQRYREQAEARVREARDSYQRGVELKREEHQRRHPRAAETDRLAPAQELGRDVALSPAVVGGDERDAVVSGAPDRRAAGHLGEAGQAGGQIDPQQVRGREREAPALHPDRQIRGEVRGRLHDTRGLLNDDRARTVLIERARDITERAKAAMEQLANSVRQLVASVRDDEKRKRELAGRSESLAPAVRALERADRQLGNADRQLESLIAQQAAQQQESLPQAAQTLEGLLDEYQKAHAERDLYFNREFERQEIAGLSIETAREYLQDSLDSRLERQQARERGSGFEM